MAWATHPLDVDIQQTHEAIERLATVSLIATLEPLHSCDADAVIRDVVVDPSLSDFDYLPVKKEGVYWGLFPRMKWDEKRSTPAATRMVEAESDRLCESNLISAEASILSFIAEAKNRPCRLILSGTEISGIVTISDLQKLPVRPVIFYLITYVELLAQRLIERRLSYEQWKGMLDDDQRNKVAKEFKKRQKGNVAIDPLMVTSFSAKMTILSQATSVCAATNCTSEQLKALTSLRNDVAHADVYAPTKDRADAFIERVQLARGVASALEIEVNRP